MDLSKQKSKLLVSIVIGVATFVALSIYSDLGRLVEVIENFNFIYLPLILILAPLNYCFRYVKWRYFLNIIDVKVPDKDNLLIFASGLAMTVSPGKVGELLKSYLLKEHNDIPVSLTAPVIMAERITDLISLLFLASFGMLAYNYGKKVMLLVVIIILLFISIIQFPVLFNRLIKLLSRIGFIKKYAESIKSFYNNTYQIFKLKPLLTTISIGIVSWFFEGIIIFITLMAMNTQISLLASIFIISFSSIVGAVSMLPGGLIAAEGSIVGLLLFMHIDKNVAVATTIITRFSTLWLGVLIGIVALFIFQRNLQPESDEDVANNQ